MGLSSASANREGVVGVIITIGFLGENEFILFGFLLMGDDIETGRSMVSDY